MVLVLLRPVCKHSVAEAGTCPWLLSSSQKASNPRSNIYISIHTRVIHGVQVMTYDDGNQGVFNSNGTYFYTHDRTLARPCAGRSRIPDSSALTSMAFSKQWICMHSRETASGERCWLALLRLNVLSVQCLTLSLCRKSIIVICTAVDAHFKNHCSHKLLERLQITVTSEIGRAHV